MPVGLLAEAAIDTTLVTEVVNLVKSFLGLFGTFPLNVFLIGGLATLAFGIVVTAKHAAN